MDSQTIASYEERAAAAERRLAALEQKLENAGSAGGVDVLRYISELQSLKEVLLLAKCEQENLENKVKNLETTNEKLQYQILHLKRAVKEADEKLKS